jgi:lipoyl(octanoyl) transferase
MRTTNPRSSAGEDIWVRHLGLVPYHEGVRMQHTLRERRIAGAVTDTLLLLEHPPTYTRGRRSGADDLPMPEAFYRDKGIEVHATDRGGKLTYHGPGQLVGYPIMRIDDVHGYLRTMEDALIAALAEAGVHAHSRHDEGIDYTGVWVEDRKIASIGVHVSRGVTTHGFAVNVDVDLEPFSWVVACGLPNVAMTSIARETGTAGEGIACFRKRVAYSFCRAHDRRQRLVSPTRLGVDTANAAGRATERARMKAIPSAPAEPVPA